MTLRAALLIACLCSWLDARPIRVVLAGDSTVNDGGGWGPGFRSSFAGIEVLNLAQNGRSSKSFRAEGLWSPAIAARPDYVLLQFGHNDGPGKGPERETDPRTTFRENMIRYVEDVRQAGATPVLVTSIVRRVFTAGGAILDDSLVPYVAEVRRIAAEKKVPLIDLYTLTRKQAEELGPNGALTLGRTGPDGRPDTTHLGPVGQQAIGAMAAREFARLVPAMVPYLRTAAPPPIRVTVAADGSGDFRTIMNAVDHAPVTAPAQRLIIELRPGIYRERVMVPPDRPRLTLRGADPATTIITFDMSAKTAGGTFFSPTVDVFADEFQAENVTIENTYGVGSQAVALSIHADRAVLRNCRLLGWQDTLYAATGRQYYRDCLIEGHVDFIFGNAAAVFENCHIHSRGRGYITAQSRTVPDAATGFVFDHCRLTGANTGTGVYLGRPWRTYARVIYLNCEMEGHILPAGWDNWRNPENDKTAWYGEFGSTGAGAAPDARVKWAHRLTDEEAAPFRPEVFLRGNDLWKP